MKPMNIMLACPIFLIIGPENTRSGTPAMPPTVIVKPISEREAPRSCSSQKRKLSK